MVTTSSATRFVGRERELEELVRHLRDPAAPLITITGFGGTGKTALATRLVRLCEDDFAGGCLTVELSAVDDAALLPLHLLAALGHSTGDVVTTDTVIAALANRHLLLLLDNFEHLLAAGPLLESIHRHCPNIWLLVTSRVPLEIDSETVYPLPPLESPGDGASLELLRSNPSVQLFLQHLGTGDAEPDVDLHDVARICRRLDGIPLALVLTARRLSRVMTLPEIERYLTVGMLRAGSHELGVRERSLQSALEWSFERFSADERCVLSAIALCNGGATVELTTQLLARLDGEAALPIETVIDAVEASVAAGYLALHRTPAVARLTMPRLLREYVTERLAAADPGRTEALRRGHSSIIRELAAQARPELTGPDSKSWGDRLEAELDNIRQALAYLLERDQPEPALEIAVAIWLAWRQRGRLAESVTWLQRGIDASVDIASIPYASACLNLGHSIQADPDRRIEAYDRAYRAFTALANPRGQAAALDSLALVALDRGDFPAAERALQEALGLVQQTDNRHALGYVLNHLGTLKVRQGDPAAAYRYLTQALAVWREERAVDNVAFVLLDIGRIERLRNRLDSARTTLRRSQAVFRQAGSPVGRGYALQELGQTCLAANAPAEAETTFREALDLFAQAQLWDDDVLAAIEGIACAAASREPAIAARLLAAAAQLRTELQFPRLGANESLVDHALRQTAARLDDRRQEAEHIAGQLLTRDETLALARALPTAPTDPFGLTPTERKVVTLTARGSTDQEIADRMGISYNTIRTHQTNIKQKLGAHTRGEVSDLARRHGLLISEFPELDPSSSNR